MHIELEARAAHVDIWATVTSPSLISLIKDEACLDSNYSHWNGCCSLSNPRHRLRRPILAI